MQLSTEERYRAWLYDALHGSGARMGALIASYGSAESVFEAARAGELTYTAGGRTQSAEKALLAAATPSRVDVLLEGYERLGITPVSRASADYPTLLKEIYDPPEMLLVKGRLRADLRLPLAVIGTRKCTAYGKSIAEQFGKELANAGACVISGLAYGLDTEAARGALGTHSDYPTVAVLGCGIDVIYPARHKSEYQSIVERGAVVSEYLPGVRPLRSNFPQRNRIISGMAKGTVVIEAGERSGTSITVGFALEQGRDVFAVPGRTTDAQSAGTNRFIRDGYAKLVLSPQDVLCEYGVESTAEAVHSVDYAALPAEQALICKLLSVEERNFDELCVLTSLPAARLNSILTAMEFSGIIRQMSGRMYRL
ncbi:MAG: DNA-processing protein DprA [Clostridia bacterium]|nr:DNA-processing protein DprA [Clostridia bacterium]